MNPLTISDLSQDKTLDAKAMIDVSGGRYFGGRCFPRPFWARRRWSAARPYPYKHGHKKGQRNNVNLGSNNSFSGNTAGVNNGTQVYITV
jgi:hypothetical protein